MDSYIPGVAIVDLKVMASITDLKWVKDIGYLDFVRYWGYDIQGAIYQKIVELNTGKKLPFFIAAVTKENEPDIRIIQITQNYLDEALSVVSANINRVLMVKNGDREPDKCELCDCCRHNRVLKAPISIIDLHPEFRRYLSMAWISVHEQVVGGKLRTLAKELNCSQNEALGMLVTLWLWGINNADSEGKIIGATRADIAKVLYVGLNEGNRPAKGG